MIRNVIFDLDGTLLDTGPGILESVRYTAGVMGWQPLTEQQLLSFIGPPLKASFVHCCGCSEEAAQQAVTVYRQHYQAGAVLHAEPYPGIPELCALLRACGVKMAVATNKPQRFADALMQHFELTEYLDPICGADEAGTLKKSDLIRLCMEKMGGTAADTVLVGDTDNDAAGAEQTGVSFAAVTYGYGFRCPEDVICRTHIGTADTPLNIADICLQNHDSEWTAE